MAFNEVKSGDLIYMTSSILPVFNAFSTRYGGVSRDGFSSMNVGENRGDDPTAVRENRRRFCALFGTDENGACITKQVHGNVVRRVSSVDKHICFEDVPYEADGIVTDEENLLIYCQTADCVPVLLADEELKAAAAVHCGWRSSVTDILANAVAEMEKLGAAPEKIHAALGPAIGKCCFETDKDVPDAVEQYLNGDTAGIIEARDGGKYRVDLRLANARRLQSLGLRAENIDISEECTYCSHDKYWSHRYLRGNQRGNLAAGIMIKR